MPFVEIAGLSHAFERGTPALEGVDFTVDEGSMLCLLGPSGCGKTTIVRAICGAIEPDVGSIKVAGEEITRLALERRGIGMVFQNYALFPHLSARDNVAFGLAARRVPRLERLRRANNWLERVHITPAEADRKPKDLSGGQQQRVALARALAIEPRLLLLDEPLANLDRRLREEMREEIRALQLRTGVTTILVTHDQDEALSIADRVAILEHGRIIQIGSPREVYERPANASVARFVGDANLWPVGASGDGAFLVEGVGVVHSAWTSAVGGHALIRPENVHLGLAARACENSFDGRVTRVSFLGADIVIDVEIGARMTLRARARRSTLDGLELGGATRVGFRAADVWIVTDGRTHAAVR